MTSASRAQLLADRTVYGFECSTPSAHLWLVELELSFDSALATEVLGVLACSIESLDPVATRVRADGLVVELAVEAPTAEVAAWVAVAQAATLPTGTVGRICSRRANGRLSSPRRNLNGEGR